MSLSRRVARPLLASIFVTSGVDAFRHPETKVDSAKAVIQFLQTQMPALPRDPITLIKLNGALQGGAGMLLAVGKGRRLAAGVLFASLVPTTMAEHRFWEETDHTTRKQERIHFFKNLGLLGGLLFAAFDTDGAPSLGWRARRKGEQVASAMGAGRAMTQSKANHVPVVAKKSGSATRQAGEVATKVSRAARRARRRGNDVIVSAAKVGASFAVPAVHQASDSAHTATRAIIEVAEPYLTSNLDRAGDLLHVTADRIPLPASIQG